ncbi:MAG: hypothetical protein K2J36_09225 [Ruminococcus sp.]|nr:hypothetical protein [Ruminococcus sp.]MDE6798176.1 hypothetical protein [Ruminococcus sp.]
MPLCSSGTDSHRSGAFTVYPDTNRYFCFSCEAKGDIFNSQSLENEYCFVVEGEIDYMSID